MPRLCLVLLMLSGCAVTYKLTGDEMFRPASTAPPVVHGPNVPEPEPQDEQYQAELEEAELPPLPAKPAAQAPKKKESKVAMKRQ
jgi:hypothetical protein